MRATSANLFQQSPINLLTRPWKKYRDGTLFYGLTKSGNKRTALTTKSGNKTFYKGTRSSGIGRHTRYGSYNINWNKVRTFVVPANFNTDLKPLVSANLAQLKHNFAGYEKGPLDSKLYFDKLKHYVKYGKVTSEASAPEVYSERG